MTIVVHQTAEIFNGGRDDRVSSMLERLGIEFPNLIIQRFLQGIAASLFASSGTSSTQVTSCDLTPAAAR
ncbi:hypothetical protein RISK_006145 [Rhodopirellula islandica]|uniref:Uncharacterized protein n=1 Tax=Rhodopirellula islandica TaxID=595434 RepID=A0A0J1B685_RHOIS|nr:hypothetical protein [Rhodopirellula islandica]KLU01961.1 hypothetical protein RISK_006145 [Rhodopirellula islandica]